jgi:hypothetical protein
VVWREDPPTRTPSTTNAGNFPRSSRADAQIETLMLPEDNGTKLNFLVFNSTRELCRVAMPLASVSNLENLFPDEDLKVVKAMGVDFAAVIARALASECAPQTLIEASTSERSYKIWIG